MSSDNEQFDLPPKFVAALREAYTHAADVPAERERFLLSAARVKFARGARVRLVARWGGGVAAGLAAVIAVVVWVNRPAAPSLPQLARGDRAVNMVDAMLLARRVADGAAVDKSWDLTGDGTVDQKDVDAVAAAAVNLKPGGGMARRGLPRMDELGIGLARVARAEVGGEAKTFAEANPTVPSGRGGVR